MKTLTLNRSQRLMAIFSLLFLFMGLQVGVPHLISPALAAGCPGGVICASTIAQATVGGNVGDGGLGGIGGGGGGGGGTVTPPAPPQVQDANGRWWPQYIDTVNFYKNWGPYAPECMTPLNIQGIEVKTVGVVVVSRVYYIPVTGGFQGGNPNWPYSASQTISKTCVYPDVSANVVQLTCLLSYTAKVDRMAQSWLGAANGVGSTSGTIASIGSLEGNNGKANCKQNASVALNYNPPSGQNGWGQYKATSNINKAQCKFLTTTFEGASTTTGKCAPLGNIQGSVGKITVWCDGYANSWVIKDWTGSDCAKSINHPLVCTIPNAATYNGYSGNVQGIRDGKDSLLKWGTPKVVGGWGIQNWRSSTVVNSGSTPKNTAVNDNDKNQQLFASSLNFSSGMTAGQNLSQQLAFYTAGDAGSPFSMTRNYKYDATFNASHTTIRSIDLKTGQLSVSSYDEAAFAKDNKCGPQVSPRIDVIRAIGDNVQ